MFTRTINVFVSSALAELEHDREIVQQAIRNMGASSGLFEVRAAMSESPSAGCRHAVRDCDIFVLLLWKSLRPAVLEEYDEAVASNKPILVFAKTLTSNEECERKLKSFISELATGSKRHPMLPSIYRNYRGMVELGEAVRESILREVARFYREPLYTLSREECYRLGTSIVRSVEKRLYIFQETPSMILGARPYIADDNAKISHDKEFIEGLGEWIQANYRTRNRELLYLFSEEATQKEIRKIRTDHPAEFPNYVHGLKQRIAELKAFEESSARRFRICAVTKAVSGPLIVGDNRFALWLLGKEDAVAISEENRGISDIMCRILKAHCPDDHVTAEELATSLLM